jgi:hypothetical protein
MNFPSVSALKESANLLFLKTNDTLVTFCKFTGCFLVILTNDCLTAPQCRVVGDNHTKSKQADDLRTLTVANVHILL